MKRLITFCLAISIIATISSQSIEGNWSGKLDVMGQSLPIVFNISKSDSAYTTTMDSPAQGAFGLPTSKTTVSGNKIEIVATNLAIFYQGKLEGDTITGTFNQNGIPFTLTLRQSNEHALNRPQEPNPPFDYKIEEISFTNKVDDNTLSGTLTIPNTSDKHPAIVLIAGSGPNDRDESIFGHKPFLVLADYLTSNGYMVLRYDKRGVGSSTGRYETATTKHFADDASAAINYLKTRNDVDKSSIGIIGHSEGGTIATMIAANRSDIKFVVMLAAMGSKGIDIIMQQNETALKKQNIEQQNIDELLEITNHTLTNLSNWKGTDNDKTVLRDQLNLLWDKMPLIMKLKMNKDQYIRSNLATMSSPWFREFIKIDPIHYLKKTNCPILALNGENDTQVIVSKNIELIDRALEESNKKYKTKVYPQLNHLFQESTTGSASEYGNIEQTISTEVLADIVEWIKNIE